MQLSVLLFLPKMPECPPNTLLFLLPHSPSIPSHSQHPPGSYQQTPAAVGNGSYKGNWESFYIRLLLVLAAIYDSTGSSDVGYRAKGEQAVSSKAIQRLVTLKPFPFYCH